MRRITRKTTTAIFAILTLVVCPLFLYFLYQQYDGYVVALLSKYPEPIRPYVDFIPPFWATIYGQVAFCFLFVLTVLWIVQLAYFVKKKHWKIFVVTATIGALLLVSQFGSSSNGEVSQVQIATPQPQNIVDVCVVLDEEYRARYPNIDYQTAEQAVQSELNKANYFTSILVTDCFNTTFGITFEIRQFVYWDSEDSVTDAYDLLQEAIRENGGVWDSVNHWYVYPGGTIEVSSHLYKLDLLMAFTGQDMDMYGLSPPMWNASICKYAGYTLMRHELSHQYWVEHCSDPNCVMNPSFPLKFDWCGTCEQFLLANRDKWVTEYQATISTTIGGQTNMPAGKYLFNRGTEITINAIPSEGYTFNYWLIDGWQTVTTNPITLTMNSDKTITVYFAQNNPSTGGSCSGGSIGKLC
jgi:hypothetical protein